MPINAAEQPDNSPIPAIKLSETALISIAAKKLSYSVMSSSDLHGTHNADKDSCLNRV
jgi:hypothetical protein